MKIAFISYEYPPDTALGGIATYVQQAARMLVRRGHYVEVIAGTQGTPRSWDDRGVVVHTLASDDSGFPLLAGRCFADRHQAVSFDALEGPEYNAEASEAVRRVPGIPLVVKLHTSTSLMRRISLPAMPWARRWRSRAGAWRRRLLPRWYRDPQQDGERWHTLLADEVAAPCRAIADEMIAEWGLDPQLVAHVPYPYTPCDELLRIPGGHAAGRTVCYLGRLELRKGVVELARAVPLVVRAIPEVRFRFVGRDREAPDGGPSMMAYLKSLMGPSAGRAEWPGPVRLEDIPGVLATADLCVYPSHWENFPLVCLEAMAAARAIVGSSAGGMAEMLDGGQCGVLVRPFSPSGIAQAIIDLLSDPQRAADLGARARQRVLQQYNDQRICQLQEESYRRAIARRHSLGPRLAAAFLRG